MPPSKKEESSKKSTTKSSEPKPTQKKKADPVPKPKAKKSDPAPKAKKLTTVTPKKTSTTKATSTAAAAITSKPKTELSKKPIEKVRIVFVFEPWCPYSIDKYRDWDEFARTNKTYETEKIDRQQYLQREGALPIQTVPSFVKENVKYSPAEKRYLLEKSTFLPGIPF